MASSGAADAWLVPLGRRRGGSLRLVCFPHAGSGPAAYRSWAEAWDDPVEVLAAQLPGHGVRLRETPRRRLADLAGALAAALAGRPDGPLAFFGHSMGGLLAFETARALRRRGLPGPGVLLVSAVAAPQLPRARTGMHALPDPELIKRLRALAGTPRAVMEHAELMEALLPAFRADLEAVETYSCADEPPLEMPIGAFGGRNDPFVSRAELSAWRAQTRAHFTLRMLAGDHFFVESARPVLLAALGRELRPLLRRTGP